MKERPSGPVPIQLEVGMLDITVSLSDSGRQLSPEADMMLEHIKSNGLGITRLDKVSESTYKIEHSPDSSGTDIVRYFGYLAGADLDGDIEFVRPDGQPHVIQIDNELNR